MVNLQKGARIDLTKGNPGLSVVTFALGWDERQKVAENEADFDPDACSVALHGSRGFQSATDMLWYNSNKAVTPDGKYIDDGHGGWKWADETRPYPFIFDGALKSSGDNRDGAGTTTDKEVITIDLSKIPADVTHIAQIITIFEVETRKQNFGMMTNAYCRIEAPGIASFVPQKADLTEDASAYTGYVMGYLYRKDGEWKYNACMKGVNGATKGADGKPIGDINITTIAPNLTSILEIAVTA